MKKTKFAIGQKCWTAQPWMGRPKQVIVLGVGKQEVFIRYHNGRETTVFVDEGIFEDYKDAEGYMKKKVEKQIRRLQSDIRCWTKLLEKLK